MTRLPKRRMLTAFYHPQWKWLEMVRGDSSTPGIEETVSIKSGRQTLGTTRVLVPAGFHHYAASIHGWDVRITGFELRKREEDRWYFSYNVAEPENTYVLWYFTQSTLPGWAKRIIQRTLDLY